MRTLLFFVASVTLLSGCAVVTPSRVRVGPPPAGGSAGAITASDAERIALRVAGDHGYSNARVEKAHHDQGQGGRWKVEVRGLADGRDGKIDVRISDGGEVLEVKDHRKGGKDDKDKGKDKDEKGKGKDK